MSDKTNRWLYNIAKAADEYADYSAGKWKKDKTYSHVTLRHQTYMGFLAGVDYVLYHRPLPRGLRRKPRMEETEAQFIANLP